MPRAFAPEMPSAHEDGCVTRADLVPHLDSSARALGKRFLLQRMDFLKLLPHRVRVVIEVDGRRHYSKEEGGQFHPSPSVCAETVRGERSSSGSVTGSETGSQPSVVLLSRRCPSSRQRSCRSPRERKSATGSREDGVG